MNVEVRYFHDFEQVFNACGTDGVPPTWAQYAEQLEKGLSIYKLPTGVFQSKESESDCLPLAGSPTDYSAEIGIHAAATAAISKILNLHEAQSLLLLKRWLLHSSAKVCAGVSVLHFMSKPCFRAQNISACVRAFADWVPNGVQIVSLQQAYAKQRWHHLLCMRYVAQTSAQDPTECEARDTHVPPYIFCSVNISAGRALENLLETVGNTMDEASAPKSLIDKEVLQCTGLRSNRNLEYCEATDPSSSELCLMLQVVLDLLKCVDVELCNVVNSAKKISTGIALCGKWAWDDRVTMWGLVPRYAVTIIIQLLRCRCAFAMPI